MLPVHEFAKRGVEVVHGLAVRASDDKPETPQINPVSALILVLTVAGFFVFLVGLGYTYGHLITTLCMVESSSSQTYVPIESVEPTEDAPPAYTEDGMPKPVDPELNIIRTQPVTVSLRATISHLQARAGFWSRFRGFGAYFSWNFARNMLVSILTLGSRNPLLMILITIFAEVALANLHMTWIHVIISEPSTKSWYQRIPRPFFRTWQKIAPAVAIWAFTSHVVTVLPILATGSWGTLGRMNDPTYDPDMKDAYASAGQLFFLAVLTIGLAILLQIPATVAMVRVAASMLPEEDETIVPFDRTFGGLTTPEIIGGQGKIGIVEAWRSFNWECRRRLLRTVVKVAAVLMTAWTLFLFVIILEAHFLFGDAFGQMMKGAHGIANRGS